MAVAITAIVAAFSLGTVALVLWHTGRQNLDRITTGHVRERYVVTLKSGETFDGTVTDADGRSLVLSHASSVAPGREPISVDGLLVLARSDVLYLQRP